MEKEEKFDEDNIEVLEKTEENNNDSFDQIEDNIEFNKPEENDKVFEFKKEENKSVKPVSHTGNSDDAKKIKFLVLALCVVILALGCIWYFGKGSNKSTSKRYEISSYVEDKVFKTIKQLSVNDSISLRDEVEDRDIIYTFKVKDGKVIIANDYGYYELKGIKKADKLVVNTMGNLLEDTGVFIVTEDGELYSISLYDERSKLITDCTSFEDKIDEYDLSFNVKSIESGFYSDKKGTGIEGIILIHDTNDNKHVLATIKDKN